MFNFFGKLTKKTAISGTILSLLAGAVIIILYIYKVINQTVFTILLFISLISFSTFSSSLTSQALQKKLLKKRHGETYKVNGEILLNGDIKEFQLNYGLVQLFFEDRVVYNLTIVENPELFFSDEQEALKYKIDQNKYKKAIQLFVFEPSSEQIYRKIHIMNYQAKNFYVASYIYNREQSTLVHTDSVKPSEEFLPLFEKFIKKLPIEEK